MAVDYIALFLDRLTRDELQRYDERYIGPYFTPDGRVDLNVAQAAVDAVAAELGVAAASVDQIYRLRPVTAAAATRSRRHRDDCMAPASSPPPFPNYDAGT